MRTSSALAVLITAALLAALYVHLRAQPPATTPADSSNARATTRSEFELTVAGGELVAGPAVIQVVQGTEVTLRIHSDRADELHLHGYDLHARIDAGGTAELSFTASRSGRFAYELHGSHRELGAVEVSPE
jgi:hypothetical protein